MERALTMRRPAAGGARARWMQPAGGETIPAMGFGPASREVERGAGA
jgi:hypothetical protein